MNLARFVGATMVSLVPAAFFAALVGRLIGGAPQLINLGAENTGEGIPIGKYFLYPAFGGSALFWVLVVGVFVILEGAGIYYFGFHRSAGDEPPGDDPGSV